VEHPRTTGPETAENVEPIYGQVWALLIVLTIVGEKTSNAASSVKHDSTNLALLHIRIVKAEPVTLFGANGGSNREGAYVTKRPD
jgi:hypothetical protein